jgi:hypothetical protein
MTDTRPDIALKIKHLLMSISPLIDEYTAAVCPDCVNVCCRQRHGLYRERDIEYLKMLGISVPQRDEAKLLDGPCESMGPKGCVQPRWMRPFKCSWYFCEPLLAALNSGPPKKMRKITSMMQEMISLYETLPER